MRALLVSTLIGLTVLGSGVAARAEGRTIFAVGLGGGQTMTTTEVSSPGDVGTPPTELALAFDGQVGAQWPHFVAGFSGTVWGATANALSAAGFGGLATRSKDGFALELSGSLGAEVYGGYMKGGGLYTDVSSDAVLLPFGSLRLQTLVPAGRTPTGTVLLGFFVEARTDLVTGTGTSTIVQRCGAVCEVLGGEDSPPEVHTFAVGGPTYFFGLNMRFLPDDEKPRPDKRD